MPLSNSREDFLRRISSSSDPAKAIEKVQKEDQIVNSLAEITGIARDTILYLRAQRQSMYKEMYNKHLSKFGTPRLESKKNLNQKIAQSSLEDFKKLLNEIGYNGKFDKFGTIELAKLLYDPEISIENKNTILVILEQYDYHHRLSALYECLLNGKYDISLFDNFAKLILDINDPRGRLRYSRY